MRYNLLVTIASLLAAAALAAGAAVPELHFARPPRLGETTLVVVTDQDPKFAPKGTFAGRDLAFFSAGSTGTWLAFAAVDLDASTGPARLTVDLSGADGTPRRWDQTLTIAARAFATRTLQVDPKYVEPPPDLVERAEREGARMSKVFSETTPERFWDGKFASPIPGAVSSRFGERSVFNGVPKAPHSGADLRARKGIPVKAAARGRVALTGEFFYPGGVVVLDHGFGVYTSYSHLSRIDAVVGAVVPAGTVIGAVGATGRVTGPHLHWAAKVANARVDPFSLIALPLDAYR